MFDRDIVNKVLCVAMVAAVMLPAGSVLFPYVSHALTDTQFQAIEAIVSATIGFGIYSIFG